MDSKSSLWTELKERRVVRVVILYLATGWAAIEGSQTLKEVFSLPDGMPRIVFALVVLGFPAAVFLAWAFQISPHGIQRAAPLEKNQRSYLPLLLAMSVTVAAITALAYIFYSTDSIGPIQAPEMDEGVVAVLPFRVSAPAELSYLGSGFMDLLSARLDGEVGPNAVDPGTVVPAFKQNSTDPHSVARAVGAGLVLTGSVVGDSDKVVANAELMHIADGQSTIRATAEGPADSLSKIADQLVVQLLSLDAGEYTTSIESLTSTSSTALKYYLQGKQAFRDGRYFVGIEKLDAALDIDPTFALAAIARADGATNAATIGEDGNLEKAWQHRDRLSKRDLEYLAVRLPQEQRTGAETFAEYEQLTRNQPDRVEAWYWFFEAMYHAAGVKYDHAFWQRVRAVGDKVLELDPDYLPVYDHYQFIEPYLGTPETIRATYTKLLERKRTHSVEQFRPLTTGGNTLHLDASVIPGFDKNELFYTSWFPLLMPFYAPDGYVEYIDIALTESRRRVGTDFAYPTVYNFEYRINVALGRPGQAEAVLAAAKAESQWQIPERFAIYDSTWHGVGLKNAAETLAALEAQVNSMGSQSLSFEDAQNLTAIGISRFVHDPAYTSDNLPARIRSAKEHSSRLETLQIEAQALLFDAWNRARNGEQQAALGLLDDLIGIVRQNPGGDVVTMNFLFAVATAYEEAGSPALALESLMRFSRGRLTEYLHIARWWRERGRLSQHLGKTAEAIEAYQNYLILRVAAEPILQAEVAFIESELNALLSQ